MDVIPAIFENDIKEAERKLALVASRAAWVQIDIADSTLVTATTLHDLGSLSALLKPYKNKDVKFEAHLIVKQPELYLKMLEEAGFSRVIAHIECADPRVFFSEGRSFDFELSLALDTDTEATALEPFLEEIDCLLILSAETGMDGREFEIESIDKIKAIRRQLPDLPIEIEGGMTPETAKIAKDAGATRIVSTSYLFSDPIKILDHLEKLQSIE